MSSGRFPRLTALILLLSAVRMINKLFDIFSSCMEGGTSVSLVPESTFRRLMVPDVVIAVAVANRAIDSDQSLLESESHARFAFPDDTCLMIASTLLLKSSFFFCIHELMSWYFPLQCVHSPGPE